MNLRDRRKRPIFAPKLSRRRGWENGPPAVLLSESVKKSMNVEELFKRHYRRMYLLATAYLRDGEAAKDTVADVFADIAEGRMMVREESAEAFLLTCVRNRCINALARVKTEERLKSLLPLDGEADDAPAARLIDRIEAIQRFIDEGLTTQTANVIRMRYRQGMSYAAIAAALGISEAAVYKHLAQGIRKLKQKFNP